MTHDEYPSSMAELVAQVQWLTARVQELEEQLQMLSGSVDLSGLRRIEYRIGKLYVKELSGTLNIGISSVGDGGKILGLQDIPGAAAAMRMHADDETPSVQRDEVMGWMDPALDPDLTIDDDFDDDTTSDPDNFD